MPRQINAVLNAEQQIILVLLAQIDLFEYLVRERHTLAVRKLTARHDAAVNFCPLDVLYFKMTSPLLTSTVSPTERSFASPA